MKPFQMLPPPVFDLPPARGMDLAAIAEEIPDPVPELTLTNTEIESIAWDVAIMPDRQQDMMTHHKLDGAQWRHLQETPAFKAGTKHAVQALKSDPNMAARMVARAGMADAVLVALKLAKSSLVEPKDRINALKLLADIVQMGDTGVGMENRKSAKGSGSGGAVVHLNFGNSVGTMLKNIIVEQDE